MAVEQGKVIAKLNEILKGKSVTDNYKKTLATKWAAKIETDEDIDAYVEDRKDDILEASKEADRRTTSAVKLAKEEAAKAITGAEPEPKTPEVPDDTPAWAKQLIESNKNLQAKVEGFEAAKGKETLAERFKKVEGFDKIPQSILNKFVPNSEDDFETAKEELSKTWGEIAPANQQQTGKKFGGDMPAGSAAKTAAGEAKPDPAVEAFAKAQNDKFLQEQSKN